MAEPVYDARSLKDRRIFLLKVFGDHEPNQPPIERRSESHAQDFDDNLPGIVERLVSAEIERVARGDGAAWHVASLLVGSTAT
jgi:hypothetical protein